MALQMLNVKKQIVTTFDGKKVPRENTRRISGEYYQPNISCFLIKNNNGEEKWFRITSPLIGYNYDTQSYDLKSRLDKDPNLIRGIADDMNKMVYFKRDPFVNVYLLEKHNSSPLEHLVCKNAEFAKKLGYIECNHNQFWYNKSKLTNEELKYIMQKKKLNYPNKVIDYSANSGNITFIKAVQEYSNSKDSITIDDSTKKAAEFIKHYSFGIEFETSTGTIPEHLLGPLGLLPLKDGSINGYEYTTVPLKGAEGLQTLKLITKELTKRCSADQKCSMHIHIGGIRREKLFVIAFYMLAYKLQKELFEMFPTYKKDQVTYLGSSKNYCQMLPNLKLASNTIYSQKNEDFEGSVNKYFNEIFMFLCGRYEDLEYHFNSYKHPQDVSGAQKWNIHSRYCYINLVPTVFSKSETVEFRLHHATMNFTKTSNWLFICLAMIRFCEKYKKEIISRKLSNYNLNTLLDEYKTNFGESETEIEEGVKIAEYLKAYVQSRKKFFAEKHQKEDYLCNCEFGATEVFSFNYEGMYTLY